MAGSMRAMNGIATQIPSTAQATEGDRPLGGASSHKSSFAGLQKEERLTELAQTKVKPSELARLKRVVKRLREIGFAKVTVSSLIRTILITGLETYEEELGLHQTPGA